ncbi:vWA domain-containing protein [Parahaliea mediterranea]|uniref:VWA domain-containing protein n=1 Tax=Parahaliea mediterranea TaxID=651086 RepID=A0A939II86_9GAMM|nr:VWA domain-containing protein [Parahaliea mediterranea]MBN7796334.1 VWA domain-containing protein [Parahaliea mediterranea]
MNDDDLKQLFDTLDDKPREDARQRAVAAALRSFDETQAEKNPADTQGFAQPRRPTPDTPSIGRRIMNVFTAESPFQRWLYSGMASAAVLVVGVLIAMQMPQFSGFDGADELERPRAAAREASPIPEVVQVEASRGEERKSTAVKLTVPPPTQQVEMQVRKLAPSVQANADFSANVPGAPQLEEIVASESRQQMVADDTTSPYYQDQGRDRFETTDANPIKRVSEAPVSTFSIDVDTAAYSFVRRQLNQGVLPQKAAVRVEEMVNYFPYAYPLPADRGTPFNTDIAVIDAPWKAGNKLVRIGIQGYELSGPQPRANLVFLLDVSGSMNSPDKLPLVKQSMSLLLSRLQPEDTVSIVVYAGAAGTVLEPTPVKEKRKILAALGQLQAGGSTAGGAGIQLAYQLAEANFIEDGVNRILLATDGDFNVGIQNSEELRGFVERKRESGVFLSVLGFGEGNYHDTLMQALAQNGNGVAAYIDTLGEAQKVLVDEATSSLFPIAKDVKIQVEFNPATVSEYRLLGYETRILAEEDFNNDAVDAGDIGAGHSVTALYEITPAGSNSGAFSESRYQRGADEATDTKAGEYGFLKLRYKLPEQDKSQLISQPITIADTTDATALRETRFAAAVAGFAELLRGGKYSGDWDYNKALELAQDNRGDDPYGYRSELVQLIRKAEIAAGM